MKSPKTGELVNPVDLDDAIFAAIQAALSDVVSGVPVRAKIRMADLAASAAVAIIMDELLGKQATERKRPRKRKSNKDAAPASAGLDLPPAFAHSIRQ